MWKASRQVGCAAVNCGYTVPKSKLREKRDSITPQVTVPGEFDKLIKRADDEEEDARAQGWYVVCEYMPPGNAVGDDNKSFRKNVLPANSKVPDPTPTTTGSPKNATSTATGDQASKTGGALRNGFDATARVLLVSLVIICVGMGL